jgi:hypothetical protein
MLVECADLATCAAELREVSACAVQSDMTVSMDCRRSRPAPAFIDFVVFIDRLAGCD